MTPNIQFKKGLNQITRKDHEGRALPRFKELLRREIRALRRAKHRDDSAEAVEKIVQENVEYHRERGFTPEEVEGFHRLYAGYWPPHKKS